MNRSPLATRPAGRAFMGSLRRVESGAPAWVDLGTTAGTTKAARFYCSLFGWSVVARHRPTEDAVGYWTFRQGGEDVGGLGPAREATWTVYMAVADVDAVVAAVTGNGGDVLVEPMTVAEVGRMAVCADPLGASFVVWSPDPAVEDVSTGPAASTCRYQLACCDGETARRFYGAVFGWEARTTPLAGGASYTEFFQPGVERSVAGMVETPRQPEERRPHWMTHVAVTDVDRTAVRAAELGGTVSVEPFDLPNVGRMAVLHDPERAAFAVLQAA